MNKLCAAVLILVGEVISIYAEVKAATLYGPNGRSIGRSAIALVACIILGGVALLAGYILALRAFRNIWIVGTISLASIVIAEPALAYQVGGQAPTKSALWGFILSVAALLIVTVF